MYNYIENNLAELIIAEEKFIKTIKDKKYLLISLDNNEVYQISLNIAEKLISIQKQLLTDNSSLIKNHSSLRYILETLIQTELLLIEPKYTYILFYSNYNHQIDKTSKIIERIKKEILIMEKYELEDTKTLKILDDGYNIGEDSEVTKEKYQKAVKELDDKADLELTMFCGNFKYFGYGLTKSNLEENILPKYQNRLQILERGKTETAKKLLKKPKIASLFQFNKQHTKVFTQLKENRTWKEKAKTAQLEEEYNLAYDLSSAVLHSTSYSYMTSKNIDGDEIEMIIRLCFQYSKKIMINLNIYTKIELLEIFKSIEIK